MKIKNISIEIIFKQMRANSLSVLDKIGTHTVQAQRIIEARGLKMLGSVTVRRVDTGVRYEGSNPSFTIHQLFCSLLIFPD